MKSTYEKPKYPGVYQRNNGDWYIKLTFIDPDTGEKVRCTHSDNYTTGEDAHKARRKYQEQINVLGVPDFYSAKLENEGNVILNASMPLQAYMRYWFETIYKPTVSIQSAGLREMDIRMHIIPALGAKKLGKLTKRDVSAMCEEMRAHESAGGKGLKFGTADRALTTLSCALRHAVEHGALKINPAVGVTIKPDEEDFEPVLLTKEQSKRLLEAAKGYTHGIGFEIQLKTGLRNAEMRGLKFCDIDCQKGTLRVRRQVAILGFGEGSPSGRREYGLTSKLKTHSSKRIVPISQDLIEAIEAHKAKVEAKIQKSGGSFNDNCLIVCTRRGTFLKPRTYQDAFKRILKQAGLPETMRIHDLRHTFATLCAEAGMPEKVLANILGHSSTAMIQRYYVGNIDGDSIAANTMKNVFASL